MAHGNANKQLLAQHLMELEKTQTPPTMEGAGAPAGGPPMQMQRPPTAPGLGAGAPAAGAPPTTPAPPPGQGAGL